MASTTTVVAALCSVAIPSAAGRLDLPRAALAAPVELVAPPLPPAGGGASIAASRTRGVAPLAVFFDGAQGGCATCGNAFHNHRYLWSFGDPTSRHDRATGPLAAHVFEKPGTYDVRVSVSEPTGQVSTAVVRITVDDPDDVFAGSKTVCFANGSDFSGAPAGAMRVTTSSFDEVMRHHADGKRLLLRRGDSFRCGQPQFIKGTGPRQIGAFGAGTSPDARGIYANNPTLVCATSGTYSLHPEGSDLTIMDVRFASSGASGAVDAAYTSVRHLFLRVSSSGFDSPFVLSQDVVQYYGSPPHDELYFVDSRIEDFGGNAIYTGGTRLAMLGNRISRSATTHTMRVTFARNCVIADNEISYPEVTRHLIKLHAQQNVSRYGRYSERIVISGNSLRCNAYWGVAVGPQYAGADEAVRDVVIERNTFIAEGATNTAYYINSAETTLRNNVIVAQGAGDLVGIVVTQRGNEPVPSGTEIYHNTIYSGGQGSRLTLAEIQRHTGSPALVMNNLLYAPRTPGATIVAGGAPYTSRNNSNGQNPMFVDPGAMNFALQPTSPAINAGTSVPVLDDLTSSAREASAIPDLGALELQSPLLDTFGAGCSGLRTGARGLPRLGNKEFWLELSAPFQLSAVTLVVGDDRNSYRGVSLPFSMAQIGAPGCAFLVAPEILWSDMVSGFSVSHRSSVPTNSSLVGREFFAQWLAASPGANPLGWSASAGLSLRIAQ